MKGIKVLVFNEEAHEARKEELMKKWYECFAENGLSSTGIRTLGKSCGCNPSKIYKAKHKLEIALHRKYRFKYVKFKFIIFKEEYLWRRQCQR